MLPDKTQILPTASVKHKHTEPRVDVTSLHTVLEGSERAMAPHGSAWTLYLDDVSQKVVLSCRDWLIPEKRCLHNCLQ